MLEVGSTVYIAGPMRGIRCFNFARFFYWQVVLEKSGYKVINPAELDCLRWIEKGWMFTEDQYDEILDLDCKMIQESADCVFVLSGWQTSEGANREIRTAKDKGIMVAYEDRSITGTDTKSVNPKEIE